MSKLPVEFAEGFCEILKKISRGDLDEAEALLEKHHINPDDKSPCGNMSENIKILINQLREGGKFANSLLAGDLFYEAPRNFYSSRNISSYRLT